MTQFLYDAESSDDEADAIDDFSWVTLLSRDNQIKVKLLDEARRDIEVQIVHSNQRRLAFDPQRHGRVQARGRSALGSNASTFNSALAEINAEKLAHLLPNPSRQRGPRNLASQVKRFARALRHEIGYQLVVLLMCAVLCVVYVISTYCLTYPGWAFSLEKTAVVLFSAHFALELLSCADVLGRLMSPRALIWLVGAILPGLVLLVKKGKHNDSPPNLGFLRAIPFAWVTLQLLDHNRVALHEMERTASRVSSLTQQRVLVRKVISLIVYVSTFVFVSTGLVIFVEQESSAVTMAGLDDSANFTFLEALYYIVLTTATIGYGEIVPVSASQQLVILVIILIFFASVPTRIFTVASASRKRSRFVGRYHQKNVRERHVVLCGTMNFSSVYACLTELYHADHGKATKWLNVVLVAAEEPSIGMAALLELPEYKGRLTYIRGSPLNTSDLERASVQNAASVLVLVDKVSGDTRKEDAHAMLIAISVLTHVQVQRRIGRGPRLLVEVMNPNSAVHIRSAGIRHVIAFNQLKLSMMAQSCLCPGWSTLVANLVRSHSALPPQALQQGTWLAEYYMGATKTIFSTPFSPVFVGLPFSEARAVIFEQFEVIVVAVEKEDTGQVIISPSPQYCIGADDRALVLAESLTDALSIWEFLGEAFSKGDAGEEAALLETIGTETLAAMDAQAYIESIGQHKLLNRCRRRMGPGFSHHPDLLQTWLGLFSHTRHLDPTQVSYPDYTYPHARTVESPPVTPEKGQPYSQMQKQRRLSHPLETLSSNGNSVHSVRSASPSQHGHARLSRTRDSDRAHLNASVRTGRNKRLDHVSNGAGRGGGEGRRSVTARGPPSPIPANATATAIASERDGRATGTDGAVGSDGRVAAGGDADWGGAVVLVPEGGDYCKTGMTDRRSGGGGGGGGGGDRGMIGEELLSELWTLPVEDMGAEAAWDVLKKLKSRAGGHLAAGVYDGRGEDEDSGQARGRGHGQDAGDGSDQERSSGDESASSGLSESLYSGKIAKRKTAGGREEGGGEVVEEDDAAGPGQTAEDKRERRDKPRPHPSYSRPSTPQTVSHLSSHIVVLGFPARPSHLAAFLRPLRKGHVHGRRGGKGTRAGVDGARSECGAGAGDNNASQAHYRQNGSAPLHPHGPPILFMSPQVKPLLTGLERLSEDVPIDLGDIYVLKGQPMSQKDLKAAGIERAKTIICFSNVSDLVDKDEEVLIDSEALVSYIKMELLLSPDTHFIIELEYDQNMRFLHTRGELSALHALSDLGDEHSYLWPKFAAGRVYSGAALDALLSQAFHRPTRIALLEQLLQLGYVDEVEWTEDGTDRRPSHYYESNPCAETAVGLYQIAVPKSLLGHCFGELYQQMICPPMCCTPIGLYRARGTSRAPEPYVYTAPRADTVLHPGDFIFMLARGPVVAGQSRDRGESVADGTFHRR